MGTMTNTLAATALTLAGAFSAAAEELKTYTASPECIQSALQEVLQTQDVITTPNGVGAWVSIDGSGGRHADVSSTVRLQQNGLVGSIDVQASFTKGEGQEVSSFANLDYTDQHGTTLNLPDSDESAVLADSTKNMVLQIDKKIRQCAAPQIMSDARMPQTPNPFKLG